jgi:hypothetical protein
METKIQNGGYHTEIDEIKVPQNACNVTCTKVQINMSYICYKTIKSIYIWLRAGLNIFLKMKWHTANTNVIEPNFMFPKTPNV